MHLNDGPYVTIELNIYFLVRLTRMNVHPELTSTVTCIINEGYKAGECKDSGKVKKIQADCVFARLEEMQSQKIIRLSELPLVGNQSIGTMPQALLDGGCKHGSPVSDGGKKKSRINFDELDVSNDHTEVDQARTAGMLNPPPHQIGNRPELIRLIQKHMANTLQ